MIGAIARDASAFENYHGQLSWTIKKTIVTIGIRWSYHCYCWTIMSNQKDDCHHRRDWKPVSPDSKEIDTLSSSSLSVSAFLQSFIEIFLVNYYGILISEKCLRSLVRLGPNRPFDWTSIAVLCFGWHNDPVLGEGASTQQGGKCGLLTNLPLNPLPHFGLFFWKQS